MIEFESDYTRYVILNSTCKQIGIILGIFNVLFSQALFLGFFYKLPLNIVVPLPCKHKFSPKFKCRSSDK